MPFGPLNVPAVFQAGINSILGYVLYISYCAYIDYILIYGSRLPGTFDRAWEAIALLKKDKIKLGCLKCSFGLAKASVLRRVVCN